MTIDESSTRSTCLLSLALRARETFQFLCRDLKGESAAGLELCGLDVVGRLRAACILPTESSRVSVHLASLDSLISMSRLKMSSMDYRQGNLCWRRLFTDATLAFVLLTALRTAPPVVHDWKNLIQRLDMAIVIAGAPGEERLDLVLDLISGIQSCVSRSPAQLVLPSNLSLPAEVAPLPQFGSAVSRLTRPPSLASFRNFTATPFILSGWANEWPALTVHPWSSPTYLLQVAGPGRVVPVEIGADYTRDDWTQQMMDWEEFLGRVVMNSAPNVQHPPVYLAQHSLLNQFPALRADVEIPDYVYADMGSYYFGYIPPSNDDQLVMNAWLGPKGTVSPAHTDPYYNFYTQVVGRKTVWLAPAHLQSEMYPFPGSEALDESGLKPASSTSLGNTSSLDVFTSCVLAEKPLFSDVALPQSLACVLEPGDMLFIPAGWWHAMRSEDISFSVSMWF